MAAAGVFALEHHIKRLELDHIHARQIAEALALKEFAGNIMPVETNIIIFEVKQRYTAKLFADTLKEKGVLAMPISPNQIRMVTHLDVSEEMVRKTIAAIDQL